MAFHSRFFASVRSSLTNCVGSSGSGSGVASSSSATGVPVANFLSCRYLCMLLLLFSVSTASSAAVSVHPMRCRASSIASSLSSLSLTPFTLNCARQLASSSSSSLRVATSASQPYNNPKVESYGTSANFYHAFSRHYHRQHYHGQLLALARSLHPMLRRERLRMSETSSPLKAQLSPSATDTNEQNSFVSPPSPSTPTPASPSTPPTPTSRPAPATATASSPPDVKSHRDKSKEQTSSTVIYLDNAEVYTKPQRVLDAINDYYLRDNANVHRGAHNLAVRATEGYEGARLKIATLIGGDDREVIYTRGTTEAINLLANTWGDSNIKEGDQIILSVMEHHSNIVPWQRLASRKKAIVRYVGLTSEGEYDIEELKKLLSASNKTKLVGVTHASNVLGTLNPVQKVCELAGSVGAKTLVDASQTMARAVVNVGDLGCDFLVASGEKMMGPEGIGFLWGKYKTLASMKPWHGGGEMIEEVYLEKSTYAPPPGRFEAGTPSIAETIGLGAAVEELKERGTRNVFENEVEIGKELYTGLKSIQASNFEILGGDKLRLGIASFVLRGVPASSLREALKDAGYRVSAGFHFAQPLHDYLNAPDGSVRVSFSATDTTQDVRLFIERLRHVIENTSS